MCFWRLMRIEYRIGSAFYKQKFCLPGQKFSKNVALLNVHTSLFKTLNSIVQGCSCCGHHIKIGGEGEGEGEDRPVMDRLTCETGCPAATGSSRQEQKIGDRLPSSYR